MSGSEGRSDALGPLRSHGKTSSDTLSLRFSRNGTKRPKDVR